jgi:putative transposase
MNPPMSCAEEYIHFLLASPTQVTATEAARTLGDAAHDAFNRLLYRQPSDTTAIWQEAKALVSMKSGALVLDDSTLDKPYAHDIELVVYHWSGKHHDVVKGINLLTLLWTGGKALIPCDFRLYDKPLGGHTKNESFRAMLATARDRGLRPSIVLFDTWYASLENLKFIRDKIRRPWMTRVAANRQVNPEGRGNRAISEIEIPPWGRRVHLRGYGFVRVFRTLDAEGTPQYWATSELEMMEDERAVYAQQGWGIEVYHRGLKQCCNVERCQARRTQAQWGHIQLSLRAFLRLEAYRLRTGISWYQTKLKILRGAIRDFIEKPFTSTELAPVRVLR